MTAHLLFDSISRNTGDIAIGIAGRQVLAARGIDSDYVDPFADADAPLIIGGGELIREVGDDFYDHYRRTGSHILNAAGVWPTSTDLDYLRDYQFVSARSEVEVDHLRTWVPDARLVPCTTTLLESPHFELDGIEPGETVVGIHLVPHTLRLLENMVDLVNRIPHKKVFIPFTHYNLDASFMRSMPFDWSNSFVLPDLAPLELHSVIRQMSYLITSSLHASIFAYSQGVSFGAVHQPKIENYFRDRGLGEFIIRDEREFVDVVDRLEHGGFDASAQVAADKAVVNEVYDEYARILGAQPASDSAAGPASPTGDAAGEAGTTERDRILLGQSSSVISDRDLALSIVEARREAAVNEAADAQRSLQDVTGRYDELLTRWWVKRGLAISRQVGPLRVRLRERIGRLRRR
ncbi:MAG: polysaccharide pyruvyl transferase family protein [Leifsonia sp.]|uniref:polysaccharide pyruvyl transferase family protein n=1 Tax=Leifsonia sp. TaxID=1870902 RepID=UPI003F7D0CFA